MFHDINLKIKKIKLVIKVLNLKVHGVKGHVLRGHSELMI